MILYLLKRGLDDGGYQTVHNILGPQKHPIRLKEK